MHRRIGAGRRAAICINKIAVDRRARACRNAGCPATRPNFLPPIRRKLVSEYFSSSARYHAAHLAVDIHEMRRVRGTRATLHERQTFGRLRSRDDRPLCSVCPGRFHQPTETRLNDSRASGSSLETAGGSESALIAHPPTRRSSTRASFFAKRLIPRRIHWRTNTTRASGRLISRAVSRIIHFIAYSRARRVSAASKIRSRYCATYLTLIPGELSKPLRHVAAF